MKKVFIFSFILSMFLCFSLSVSADVASDSNANGYTFSNDSISFNSNFKVNISWGNYINSYWQHEFTIDNSLKFNNSATRYLFFDNGDSIYLILTDCPNDFVFDSAYTYIAKGGYHYQTVSYNKNGSGYGGNGCSFDSSDINRVSSSASYSKILFSTVNVKYGSTLVKASGYIDPCTATFAENKANLTYDFSFNFNTSQTFGEEWISIYAFDKTTNKQVYTHQFLSSPKFAQKTAFQQVSFEDIYLKFISNNYVSDSVKQYYERADYDKSKYSSAFEFYCADITRRSIAVYNNIGVTQNRTMMKTQYDEKSSGSINLKVFHDLSLSCDGSARLGVNVQPSKYIVVNVPCSTDDSYFYMSHISTAEHSENPLSVSIPFQYIPTTANSNYYFKIDIYPPSNDSAAGTSWDTQFSKSFTFDFVGYGFDGSVCPWIKDNSILNTPLDSSGKPTGPAISEPPLASNFTDKPVDNASGGLANNDGIKFNGDFDLGDFKDTISGVTSNIGDFVEVMHRLFIYVPAQIWALIIIIITLAIGLRVLGR